MWQRFTEKSRQAILLSQAEAIRTGAGDVETEHLLLALVQLAESGDITSLQTMGVNSQSIREYIESQIQAGNMVGAGAKLSPQAKRVLELAADEARRMQLNYIGTEHLLLALLREKDGLASTALKRQGLKLYRAREQVQERLEIGTEKQQRKPVLKGMARIWRGSSIRK